MPPATVFGMTYEGSGFRAELPEEAERTAVARPTVTRTAAATATAVRTTRRQKAGRFTDALPAARQKNEATGRISLRNAAVGTLTVPHEGLRVRQASAYTP